MNRIGKGRKKIILLKINTLFTASQLASCNVCIRWCDALASMPKKKYNLFQQQQLNSSEFSHCCQKQKCIRKPKFKTQKFYYRVQKVRPIFLSFIHFTRTKKKERSALNYTLIKNQSILNNSKKNDYNFFILLLAFTFIFWENKYLPFLFESIRTAFCRSQIRIGYARVMCCDVYYKRFIV